MKHRQIVLGALFTFAVISPVHAADVAAGRAKAMSICAECHGAAGISVVDDFPNLAGQKELYLVTQLKSFRAGTRKNIEMNYFAKSLSDADIANLAAYFAGLPYAPKGAAQ